MNILQKSVTSYNIRDDAECVSYMPENGKRKGEYSEDKPSKEDIIKAALASGYIMEQEVATSLESLGYFVKTNQAYQDIETNGSREIDVYAMNSCKVENDENLFLTTELMCECKNNTNPFIFIGRKKNGYDNIIYPQEYLFPIQLKNILGYYQNDKKLGLKPNYTMMSLYSEKDLYFPSIFHRGGLNKHHYYYSSDTKCIQFAKIYRKDGKPTNAYVANHEGIFNELVYPIVKSFLYLRNEAIRSQIGVYFDDKIVRDIFLFFPVVVLNGDMYYIDSMNSPIEPIETSHVTLVREINSPRINGTFRIDFVQKSHLEEFIKSKINPFVNGVIDEVKKNPKMFALKQ